jgi:hypothetical protein
MIAFGGVVAIVTSTDSTSMFDFHESDEGTSVGIVATDTEAEGTGVVVVSGLELTAHATAAAATITPIPPTSHGVLLGGFG